MSRTEADGFFDSLAEWLVKQGEMEEKLDNIFELKDDKWDNIEYTFDWYDYSFEIHKMHDLEWIPTKEQMLKCWEIGFAQFWINYIDHTERHGYNTDNKLSDKYTKIWKTLDGALIEK